MLLLGRAAKPNFPAQGSRTVLSFVLLPTLGFLSELAKDVGAIALTGPIL